MLLKNLMEDKQLDFNQPLLSVRRYTPPVAAPESKGKRKTDNSLPKIPRPPIYKSELKSGPIRNPGTVPFVWEKTPGRPKEERSLQAQALERPPVAPKLPPGRVLDDKQHSSRKASDCKAFTPSPTGSVPSSSQNVSSSNQIEMHYESCSASGEMEETRSSGSKGSDEAYVDALDTLSRTESFFFNCSISGISGLEGAEIKPSGIFSADPQTRDFMMGRFLPAAQAVASETPPYATRMQPVAREPERQIKKPVIVEKQQPLFVSCSNNFQNHAQDSSYEESEDEDDYSQSDNISTKVCGLFPQSLLKNSFCLLNPVPGMKISARKPVKQAYSVRRRQAKSSNLGSGGGNADEHAKVFAQKGLTDISRTEGLTEDKKKLNSGYSQTSHRSDYQRPDGASHFRHLQGNDVSSYCSQTALLVHKDKGFLGIPENAKNYGASSLDSLEKGGNNFRELLAIERIDKESGSDSPVVEKTLYVDSVHKVIPSNSYFLDKVLALAQHTETEDDSVVLIKPGEMKETHSVDSSLQDTKHFNNVDDEKAIVQHNSVEPVDSCFPFSIVKHSHDMQLDAKIEYRRDQHLIEDLSCLNVTENRKGDMESQMHSKLSHQRTAHGPIQDSITFTKSKVVELRKVGSESHLEKKSSSNEESSHGSSLKLPLGPPLPKAPSESWLKRTLPTVSSGNASSRFCLGTCNYFGTQASPVFSSDPKWETIVRSSNIHHGRLRFSEEQLPPIPEA